MTAAAPTATDPRLERSSEPDRDQFVRLRFDWARLLAFLALKGDAPVPRVTYLRGTLELMSPSTTHEGGKKRLARLVERYAGLLDVHLEGYGSWTLSDEEADAAVEPDECYVRDGVAEALPDLAIEVVHTSGGLSKLEAYRRLGVREVWYWAKQRLQAFELREGVYVPIRESAVVPEMDLELIATCMAKPTQRDALETLEAELRRRGQGRDERSR